MRLLLAMTLALILTAIPFRADAQVQGQIQAQSEPSAQIEVTRPAPDDEAIERRLSTVLQNIDALSAVDVSVTGGIAHLDGEAANDSVAEQAVNIARRVEGVIEVEDNIFRTRSVRGNVQPVLERLKNTASAILRAWPLVLVALCAFLLVFSFGLVLASFAPLWRLLAPNRFLARMYANLVKIAGFIGGLLLALSLLDAMALFGVVAGGAGLIGLALGFAVRDTIENYIASIMLSLRQPFRPNDHIVIGEHEGVVIRLTSRATILMTLQGNHLRIPNAQVFKSVILNYTRNPQRRLDFLLGVDADDNPLEAMKRGIEALRNMAFVLDDPAPSALITEVGDSNIVIQYMAWIDQRQADFLKSRSAAIAVVKSLLEAEGFTLPEPIYRVRLDQQISMGTDTQVAPNKPPQPSPRAQASTEELRQLDVEPEKVAEEQADEDRAINKGEDLLDPKRPTE